MAAQALYRKWRSQDFAEVVGQEHITLTLRNALREGRMSHAYLFTGPRGTGKTSTARILAKAINCLAPDPAARPCNVCAICVAITEGRQLDLIEIDAASNRGIDEIRDLREKIAFRPNEARYKVYVVDECFRYEDLVTLADGSKMPIGKIVEDGLYVEVLSYNEQTHRIEPKPVVRHMHKPPTLPMVRIVFDNNRVLASTLNHKFYTPNGLLHAGELATGQFVYANYERITEHQLTAIAGMALGDGHLSLTGSLMRARLSITQGVAQKDYLDYKVQLLGDLVETPPTHQRFPQTYSSKGAWRVATVSRPQIAELQRRLYDGLGHRRITRSYLDELTSLSLALWYLDDGSLITQSNPYRRKDGTIAHYPATRSTLSIDSLSLEEGHLIRQWLQERWGIEGGVAATTKGPVIWLTLPGTERLHQLIARFVPPMMAYKLLPAHRDQFCPPTDDGTPAGLAVSVVKQIERVLSPDQVYNIEVADNHNYFIRDILVANCHMLTKEAFNALLKTLEEPPPHALFVLATTEPDRVPETVRSRCQRFDFRRIPTAEIVEHLGNILRNEEGKAESEALVAIARRATGSMRDAVSLLDQLLSYGDDTLTLDRVERVLGLVNAQTIGKLVDGMAANDAAGGLALLNNLVADGIELGQLVDQIIAYLRAVLFARVARTPELLDLPQDVIQTIARQAEVLSTPRLLNAVREFTEARAALRDQVPGVPQLPIELAFLRSAGTSGEAGATTHSARAPAVAQGAAAPSFPAPAQMQQRQEVVPGPLPAATGPTQAGHPSAPPARPPAALPDNELRQAVQANWERFLGAAGKRCGMKVQAALRSVKEIDTVGEAVVLHFSHTFSRDLVNQADNRTQVEALWEELLNARVQVRCALVGEAAASPPASAPGLGASKPQSDDDAFLDDARSLGAVVRKLN